jgi:hypothetical protein
MNMPGHPFPLRLAAYGESLGVRDELIGDLLEEIARGRSRWWVCRQVAGVYGLTVVSRLRARTRLTPLPIALGLAALLVVAASIAPMANVLLVWLGVYYAAGMLSLFAHMAPRARAPLRE